uniref:Putative 2-oxoacid dependent dioxygenase n=1 Tax=Noccaea caerulescens TaxID=107243 RepID=A0A1J3D436_NOCCA
MEPKYTVAATFDRASEVKAFDEMKTGVKGLVDAGNTKIPRIFHNPEASIIYPKHPSSVTIPTVDLGGVLESKATRESVVAKVRDSMERFGFCEVINHGIPLHVMDKMRDGVRGFHDQDPQVRKTFYSRENKLLSNDKFVSVEHRILANRDKELRISVGAFFVHPSPGSRLYGPIKELLSEENPPKYRDTHVQLSNHYVARSLDGNSSLRHLRI